MSRVVISVFSESQQGDSTMGLFEAEAAMLALEMAHQPFDYNKVDYYRAKIRRFVEREDAMFPGQPFLLDVSFGRTQLPDELNDRLEKWMLEHPAYSPFMKTFGKNYLISLLDDNSDKTLYPDLADCVAEGADFYLESGMVYLRDAGAVPIEARFLQPD